MSQATTQSDELAAIKRVADEYLEFDAVYDQECVLPPLAGRVYGDYAELLSRVDALKSQVKLRDENILTLTSAAALAGEAHDFSNALANINDTCRSRGFTAGPSGKSTEDRVIAMAQSHDALTARLSAAEAELAEAQADEELAARGAVEMLHQAEQIQGRLSAAEASLSAIVAVLDEAGVERERECEACAGSGECQPEQPSMLHVVHFVPCPKCAGKGMVPLTRAERVERLVELRDWQAGEDQASLSHQYNQRITALRTRAESAEGLLREAQDWLGVAADSPDENSHLCDRIAATLAAAEVKHV